MLFYAAFLNERYNEDFKYDNKIPVNSKPTDSGSRKRLEM